MLKTDMSVDFGCSPWVGQKVILFCRFLFHCSVPKKNITGSVGLTNGLISVLLATKEGFKDVVVTHAKFIFGGYSRETWRIAAKWITADGVRTEKSM